MKGEIWTMLKVADWLMGKRSSSKSGRLLELSPLGTGFIEDSATGARYGFHISMLREAAVLRDAPELDGRDVKFEVSPNGKITNVTSIFAYNHSR